MKTLLTAIALLGCVGTATYALTTTTAHDEFQNVDFECKDKGTYDEFTIDIECLGYTSADYKIKVFCTPWGYADPPVCPPIPEAGTEVEVYDSGSFDGLSPFNNSKLVIWKSDSHMEGKHPRADYLYQVNCKLYKWDPNTSTWEHIDSRNSFVEAE